MVIFGISMLNKNKKTKRLHTGSFHFPKLEKCHLLQSWQEPKWCLGTETATGQERPVIETKRQKHQCACGHTTHAHASHSNTSIIRLPVPSRKAGSHWENTRHQPVALMWTHTCKPTHKRTGICHVHWPTDYPINTDSQKTHQARISY